VWIAASFTTTIRSASNTGRAPYSAGTSAPSVSNIFSSSTPRTGRETPKRSCTALLVSPAL